MRRLDLLVAADDRTGALEVAAALADLGGPVLMMPWASLGDDPTESIIELEPNRGVVVDLGSRHLAPGEAAARAVALDAVAAGRHAHKIDSALRGNWAAELAARLAADPRPAVVAAALPSVGRSVRKGVVRQTIDGRPVPIAEVMAGDPRRPPSSSRPADHLRAAGVADVTDGVPVDVVGRWLADRATGAVIPDLDRRRDLTALADALADHHAVLFAGTAEAIAAWAAATARHDGPAAPGSSVAHVVVVVGSRHERAHRQVERLRRHRNADRVTLVVAPSAPAGPVGDDTAASMAAELATSARRAVTDASALVVIGGDTAAAVLGDGPRRVVGTIGPGTARSFAMGVAPGPPTITRAGSFGEDDALADLVDRLLTATPSGG